MPGAVAAAKLNAAGALQARCAVEKPCAVLVGGQFVATGAGEAGALAVGQVVAVKVLFRGRLQPTRGQRPFAVGGQKARQLLDDYDGAPLLALTGAENGERPMAEMLGELGRGGQERTAALVEEMLALDPARLSARWARCLVNAMGAATARRLAANRRTFAFIDELQWFHLQVVLSSSANVRLLLERLCHRWQALMAG